MQLVNKKISIVELKKLSEKMFGRIVKAVVDIEKEIMVIDAIMHADQEYFLLEAGSQQKNLWGINIHPFVENREKLIEFDSMINLRPSFGNISRGVDDPKTREKITNIVMRMIEL